MPLLNFFFVLFCLDSIGESCYKKPETLCYDVSKRFLDDQLL